MKKQYGWKYFKEYNPRYPQEEEIDIWSILIVVTPFLVFIIGGVLYHKYIGLI